LQETPAPKNCQKNISEHGDVLLQEKEKRKNKARKEKMLSAKICPENSDKCS
jgi:hypothetical protein